MIQCEELIFSRSWGDFHKYYACVYLGSHHWKDKEFKLYVERPLYYKTEVLFVVEVEGTTFKKAHRIISDMPGNSHSGWKQYREMQKIAIDCLSKIIVSDAI